MSSDFQNTDDLIRHLGGCSLFQCCVTSFGSLVYMAGTFNVIFMSFEMHNPGWRCLDDATSINTTTTFTYASNTIQNITNPSKSSIKGLFKTDEHNISSYEVFSDSCDGFQECQNIQLNNDESTIVTEWSLICGDSLKVSTITFVQMIGMTLGQFISGYLGDAYGRKLTITLNMLAMGIFSLLSVASVSWKMFAVFRFLTGLVCGIVNCMANVYMVEFITLKWRAIVPSLPTWGIACVLISLCAMVFKDWKYLLIFNGVFTLLSLIPALFLPESIRWLIINKKENKSNRAVKLMAKFNKVDISGENVLKRLFNHRESFKLETTKIYSFTRLFSGRFRKYTIILSTALAVANSAYFASSFGVGTLPGNLYVNSIIIYITDFPTHIFVWIFPNLIGRRPTLMIFFLLQAVSLCLFLSFDIIASGSLREIGMLVFIIIARNCCSVNWYVALTCSVELYPTVIRAAAMGCMVFVSGITVAISPYLTMSSYVSHISYSVMAALSLVCSVTFCCLPETLGKDLQDDMVTVAIQEI